MVITFCRPPGWWEREEKNIIFLGEWVRWEVRERTGSSGRFEGEKEKRGSSEREEKPGSTGILGVFLGSTCIGGDFVGSS